MPHYCSAEVNSDQLPDPHSPRFSRVDSGQGSRSESERSFNVMGDRRVAFSKVLLCGIHFRENGRCKRGIYLRG